MQNTSADLAIENPAEAEQVRRLQRLPELVNRDTHLVHRGRFVTLDFQIVVGNHACFISVVQGRIERVELAPQRMRSSAFVIRATPQAWEKFWQPMPEVWWHDLFAMSKKGNATIEGNLHPFMANLQYFKDVIAAPRYS